MQVGYFEMPEQNNMGNNHTSLSFRLSLSPTSLFLAEDIFTTPVQNMRSKMKTKQIWEESELLPLMQFCKFITSCKLHLLVFLIIMCGLSLLG